MQFLLLVGSTRDGRKTIHAAKAARKAFEDKGHDVELFDLKEKDIPFLGNRTYREEGPVPEDIQDFSEKVKQTDCLIIVSPEYNHSIPGVLKNALDYLYPEYNDKPFAYMTTSAGGFGGVRSLSHLHDITLELGGFPGPNMPVSNIGSAFSEDGEILDESYHDRFDKYIEKVVEHVEKIE